MQLTDEQEAICSTEANTLLVTAFAGCGKTSVLAEYAKRRPREQFLYLAFNKTIKQEAETKFPGNVKCLTTHGLAYSGFGRHYTHKLGNPKPYQLANALGIDLVSAGVVLDVVNAYFTSTDNDIVPYHARRVRIEEQHVGRVVDYAKKAWGMMQDRGNTGVSMPHDGYLKLFQLSRPTIRKGCILLDEAQDSNQLIYAIVKQQDCRKILVGDPYQGIYGFRGAVNAMEDFKHIADEQMFLTASFRFGAGLASLATMLLKDWRGEKRPLRGLGAAITQWGINTDAPHTVISRSNSALFSEAVSHVLAGRPFAYLGGVENYRMSSILDAFYLSNRTLGLIKDRFFQAFKDWEEFRRYAESLEDRESISLIKIVETYGSAIPGLVERIRKETMSVITGKEIILTTAHKAKGLEWEYVRLLDDYAELAVGKDKKTGKPEYPDQEEINLHYVAMTRALKGLQVGDKVIDWLREFDHRQLLFPILSGFKRDYARPALPQQEPVTEDGIARVNVPDIVKRLRSGEQLSKKDANIVASIIESWCVLEDERV